MRNQEVGREGNFLKEGDR